MNNSDKNLEYLRGLQKLLADPVKKSDYTSPLDQDVMKVKGAASSVKEPITRIKGMTEHIDTKGMQKLGNAADTMKANADKIARMKALRALGKSTPVLGAITALGAGLMSDNASASEIAGNIMEELPGDLPGIGQVYDAVRAEPTGAQLGSFEDRLEKGQLTPEEMEMLRTQYLNRGK